MILRFGHTRRTDAELAALVSEGDERAFVELLKRYQNMVYGFARRMLKDSQEAEDAAQEVFLRLYLTSGSYRSEGSMKTFLLRMTHNICVDLYRKKRPELLDVFPEVPSNETPLGLLEEAIESERLERAIDGLPVKQRTVLLLRHMEQLPYGEIADVMDLSVRAVESLLVRARRTLRLILREYPE